MSESGIGQRLGEILASFPEGVQLVAAAKMRPGGVRNGARRAQGFSGFSGFSELGGEGRGALR